MHTAAVALLGQRGDDGLAIAVLEPDAGLALVGHALGVGRNWAGVLLSEDSGHGNTAPFREDGRGPAATLPRSPPPAHQPQRGNGRHHYRRKPALLRATYRCK